MSEKEICYEKRIPLLSTISIVAVLIIGAIVYINMNSNNNTVGIQYVPDRPEAWNENLSGDKLPAELKFPVSADCIFRLIQIKFK